MCVNFITNCNTIISIVSSKQCGFQFRNFNIIFGIKSDKSGENGLKIGAQRRVFNAIGSATRKQSLESRDQCIERFVWIA
jgi:hypothetical protein